MKLPQPPAAKEGWPWAVTELCVDETNQDDSMLPWITIVTPSYNQGPFIEETIRSVLNQGYRNLQYIIVDGGSNDESVEIISKYAPWLDYWVSEPDRGQAHAINKGFKRTDGSLVSWLNSDDYLLPGALELIATAHMENPDAIIAGSVDYGYETERDWKTIQLIRPKGLTFSNFVQFWFRERIGFGQPGVFFPAEALRQVGYLDESLRYALDWDLMCRLLQVAPVRYIDAPIARFRLHPQSKTMAEGHHFLVETSNVSKRYWHLIGDINEQDHDAYLASGLFLRGARRLRWGNMSGLYAMRLGFQINPSAAIKATIHVMSNKTRRLFRLS